MLALALESKKRLPTSAHTLNRHHEKPDCINIILSSNAYILYYLLSMLSGIATYWASLRLIDIFVSNIKFK